MWARPLKFASQPLKAASLAFVTAAMLLAGTALIARQPHGTAPDEEASVASAIEALGSSPTGCVERGGIVALRSSGRMFCKIDFPDGGLACADTSDCLGGCVFNAVRLDRGGAGATGVCRSSNAHEECLTPVVNGAAVRAASCALF